MEHVRHVIVEKYQIKVLDLLVLPHLHHLYQLLPNPFYRAMETPDKRYHMMVLHVMTVHFIRGPRIKIPDVHLMNAEIMQYYKSTELAKIVNVPKFQISIRVGHVFCHPMLMLRTVFHNLQRL